MPLPIEDYGLIGECHTAALVGRDGSIDWLCLPRFDSGACFAALLGEPEHGRWLLAPVAPAAEARCVRRQYRAGTLILETEFESEEGERTPFALNYRPSHQAPLPALDPEQVLTSTERNWRQWSDRCAEIAAKK